MRAGGSSRLEIPRNGDAPLKMTEARLAPHLAFLWVIAGAWAVGPAALNGVVVGVAVAKEQKASGEVPDGKAAVTPGPGPTSTGQQTTDTAKVPPRRRTKAVGGGTRVPLQPGPDRRSSNAQVCASQCNLQRSACDSRGPSSFRDRADEIRAAQSSCYLAVQSCLARCR